MRRLQLIFIIFIITALSACDNDTSGQENETLVPENKIESKAKSVNHAVDISEEVIEMPTARTTEIDNPPFQQYSASQIKELQKGGEVVYLYDDFYKIAKEIEKAINEEYVANIEMMEITDEEIELLQKEALESYSQYLTLYINEIKEYSQNEEFLDTLIELSTALENHDKEMIINLLIKAKDLK